MNCAPCIQQILAFFLSFHSFLPFSPTTPCICSVTYQSTHTNKTQQQQKLPLLFTICFGTSVDVLDCKRIFRQRKLRHLTSTFHTLPNIITSVPIPDGISYPIYPWSDGGYYVKDALQNKMYHPGLILGLGEKNPKNQHPQKTPKHLGAKTRDC